MNTINVKELVPKDWIQEEFGDTVKVWFSAKRGNHHRKAFIFPKQIAVDETFAEAIGLLIGDGDMHRTEKRHLTFASKDLELSKFVLDFLVNYLSLNRKDITFLIQFRYIEPKLTIYAEALDTPVSNIKKRFSERHKYPVTHIQANGVVFRLVFEKILDYFLESNFLNDSQLRRGFLRGLFAAEGCVAIKWSERYINHVSFALSAKETYYANLLHKALSLEGISFESQVRKSCIETIIWNWTNYLKLWEMNIFDLCKRKRKAFLSIARTSMISVVLSQDDLQLIADQFLQWQLADILDSHQGNISRTLRGQFLFSYDHFTLLKHMGLPLTIRGLRIGVSTILPYTLTTQELFALT